VRKTTTLLGVLLLVAACSMSSRMTPAERLDWYRAHAGEPVRSIAVTGRLWGWRSLGDRALTIWTRSDQGFLVDLTGACPEMAFAKSIGVTTRNNRVQAGFDSVVVQRGGIPGGRTLCRIDTIRPLNTSVVKEAKSDLNDADLVERDPSMPDEPQ
jgi:hypothetical protein